MSWFRPEGIYESVRRKGISLPAIKRTECSMSLGEVTTECTSITLPSLEGAPSCGPNINRVQRKGEMGECV